MLYFAEFVINAMASRRVEFSSPDTGKQVLLQIMKT